jgi:subtilisin family serine protease
MAALIAAHGHGPGNADGVLGIAPDAKILPVRTRAGRTAANTVLVAGIEWAALHGARVICVATGGPNDLSAAPTGISRAIAADTVIVAAAGNRPDSISVAYPAAYPGVLAVAGVDRDGRHASISATGPQVGIAAPAVDIVSEGPGNVYAAATGTSDATAIVAGAAALVRSRFPTLSAREVIHRLEATAIDKGPPGRDEEYGYGVLNLVGALTAVVPPLEPSVSPGTRAPPAEAAPQDHGSATGWAAVAILALAAVVGIGLVAGRRPATTRPPGSAGPPTSRDAPPEPPGPD